MPTNKKKQNSNSELLKKEEIIKELENLNSTCHVYDPIANREESKKIYNLELKKELRKEIYHQ